MTADISVRLICPNHRAGNGIINVQTVCPELALGRVLSILDLRGEVCSPGMSPNIWLPAVSAQHLLGDARVPDVVQIQLCVLPFHVDAVAALGNVLRVQRLMNVADKVNDKLGGLGTAPGVEIAVQQLGGVVLDGADNASVLLAVPLKVDAAISGRRVLCVDKMEILSKAAPSGIPDAIRPRRDAGEIVLGIVAQEVLEISSRLVLDKVAGKVGDGNVTQTCCSTWDQYIAGTYTAAALLTAPSCYAG